MVHLEVKQWCVVLLLLAGCGAPSMVDGGTGGGASGGGSVMVAGGSAAGGSAVDGGLGATQRCEAVKASVQAAGFADRVTVTCDPTFAWIGSNTFPAHPKMNGILGTNDQVPVPAQGYRSPVTLLPRRGAQPITIDAALAVAVNGVPIYDYSSQNTLTIGTYDPRFDTVLTHELDLCNGHSGRGDDYHYHAAPTCMVAAMPNRGPGAILGWAFDGYPLYGDTNPDGTAIADGGLDVCNGQSDAVFGYRYHTSPKPPYIIQCLTGQFDLAMAPRVRPLSGQGGGGGRTPGEKPPGGVQNLTFVEEDGGVGTMTYQWQGRTFSISYRPASAAGCYEFREQSFTTDGGLRTGTYCRQ